jgi:hypothetical protein
MSSYLHWSVSVFYNTLSINSYIYTIIIVCYVMMEPVAGSLGATLVATIYLVCSRLVLDPSWNSAATAATGMPVWATALAVHVT